MADWEQEHKESMATDGAMDTSAASSEIVVGDYNFNFGDYLSKGWSIFASKMGAFIGFTLIFLVINAVLGFIPVLGTLGSIVINAPLSVGFYIVARKIMNEEDTEFGDFFKGFDHFLPLFLASLVSGIFVLIGIVLFVIPGIYLMIAYMFTSLIIINRDIGFFDAMELSRKLITKKWFAFFGFAIVLGLINFAGILLLGIGILFTLPFTICAVAVAFDDIVNKQLAQ